MIAFGPVPSRRLGRSLGINHIPPKVCTYACVYCQLGRTIKMQVERGTFYEPEDILKDVRDKVEKSREVGEAIDYLSFVPDGEPTLDVNLGREIELLKPLGIKIAVITNGSTFVARGCAEGSDASGLGLPENRFHAIASRVRKELEERSISVVGAIGYEPEIFQPGLEGRPVRRDRMETDIGGILDQLL